LAKLALQVEPGKALSAEVIRGTVAFQREQEIYDMTNALAAGRTAEAVRKWRQLLSLDSSAEFRAVTWLGMWLEDARTFLIAPGSFKNFWRYKERFGEFKLTAQAMGKEKVGQLVERRAQV